MEYQFSPSDDIRREVFDALPYAPKDRSALEQLELWQLLIVYWNWMNQLVPERAYTVHSSDALLANPLAAEPRQFDHA